MAEKAFITLKVLKWARVSARMSEETAASKVPVSIEKFKKWESGDDFPTIKQAQKLAKAYKRPFAIFFLPDIPNDFQPLQDFRRIGSKAFSTSSMFIIREIQQKQSWIRELREENNENELPFIGKFSLKNKPEIVAQDILKVLDINPLQYKLKNPILEWIEKAEAKGILISRTSFINSKLKIDSDEIQGFAISDKFAPFVFINSSDWNAPQLFTLVHEIAHLWIAKTGISSEIEKQDFNSKINNPIEYFCNEVAANALIPEHYIVNLGEDAFVDVDEVLNNAKKIGVSSFSFIVRALKLKILSIDKYYNLKKVLEIKYQEILAKEVEDKIKRKQGEKQQGPDYYLLQLNRNSKLFTQTVLDAFRSGVIEPTTASNLLNIKVNKFPKLEEYMYRKR